MTPSKIMEDIYDQFEENLEMMDVEEKFRLISNILVQNLALEMAEKEHYKSCFEALCKGKGINS